MLSVWLLTLGVAVSHGRHYHPRTQGKDERFHRTLQAEVPRWERFDDLVHCQRRFDAWREIYNLERPHQALDMKVPAGRYMMSERTFPETLPPIEYRPGEIVRKARHKGKLNYKGHAYNIAQAFKGYPVALRPTQTDGLMDVVFRQHTLAQIDLRTREVIRL